LSRDFASFLKTFPHFFSVSAERGRKITDFAQNYAKNGVVFHKKAKNGKIFARI